MTVTERLLPHLPVAPPDSSSHLHPDSNPTSKAAPGFQGFAIDLCRCSSSALREPNTFLLATVNVIPVHMHVPENRKEAWGGGAHLSFDPDTSRIHCTPFVCNATFHKEVCMQHIHTAVRSLPFSLWERKIQPESIEPGLMQP